MVNNPVNGRKVLLTAGLACVIVSVMIAGFAGDADGREPRAERPAAIKLPELIAVRVHADWCKDCKKLDPVYSELKARTGGKPVLFVTLDKTDKASSQQAEYLAGVLGIEDAWSKYGKKVGTVLLIDAKRKSVATPLKADSTFETIEAEIRRLLSS